MNERRIKGRKDEKMIERMKGRMKR